MANALGDAGSHHKQNFQEEQDGVLKVCSVNVNGLQLRKKNPKFQTFMKQYDLICLQETHCSDESEQIFATDSDMYETFHLILSPEEKIAKIKSSRKAGNMSINRADKLILSVGEEINTLTRSADNEIQELKRLCCEETEQLEHSVDNEIGALEQACSGEIEEHVQSAGKEVSKLSQSVGKKTEVLEQSCGEEIKEHIQSAGREIEQLTLSAGSEIEKLVNSARCEIELLVQAAAEEINGFVESASEKLNQHIQAAGKQIELLTQTAFLTHSGGIAMAVKKDTFQDNGIRRIDSDCKFVLWVHLQTKTARPSSIVVGAVYVPPYTSPFSDKKAFEKIADEMKWIKSTYPDLRTIYLIGDFSARTGRGNDLPESFAESETIMRCRFSSDSELDQTGEELRVDQYGKELLRICNENDLIVLNGRCGHDKNKGQATCFQKRKLKNAQTCPGRKESANIVENNEDPLVEDSTQNAERKRNSSGKSKVTETVVDYGICSLTSLDVFVPDFHVHDYKDDQSLSDVHAVIEVVLTPKTSPDRRRSSSQAQRDASSKQERNSLPGPLSKTGIKAKTPLKSQMDAAGKPGVRTSLPKFTRK